MHWAEISSGRKLALGVAASLTCLVAGSLYSGPVYAGEAQASDWVDGFKNSARLHIGAGMTEGTLFAGLEIRMPDGWKTYWRSPGEAGGIPPEIDVTQSENLASAELLFPVPQRLPDKSGEVLGYKSTVTFPIRLKAKQPGAPIALRLTANYGVCNDICVPAEAMFDLQVPVKADASPIIDAALARVPVKREALSALSGEDAGGVQPSPRLAGWDVVGEGDDAILRLTVDANGPADRVDAFVDVADGTYVPRTIKTKAEGNQFVFEVALRNGASLATLTGKPLTVTLSDETGNTETTIQIK